MKGIVVYYSGSGNNHKIGQAIHRGIKQIIDCDVASVKDINPRDLGEYDLVGIGSPIWYFREVASVREFIYYMPDMKDKMAFIFSTHGTMPSGIFHSMIPQVLRKNLTLIGWGDWFGSSYYTLHGVKPYPLDGHPDAEDLSDAENFGKEMAQRAQRIMAGEKDLIPEIPHGAEADPLFHPHGVMTFFPGADKAHRSINTAKCLYPKCTMCSDICDAKAINLKAKPPAFNYQTCLNCCFCDRTCPTGAIEIPAEELLHMRTAKRIDMSKCKYPECTICRDHCSMNAIDFSVNPPVFNHRCEGDDLCWVICPEGAVEITNLEQTHKAMERGPARRPAEQQDAGKGTQPPRMANMVDQREAQGRFRRHIPKGTEGSEGKIIDIQRTPRFDINILMKETPAPIYYANELTQKPKTEKK